MTPPPIIIRGGGITGLWTRFALEAAGYESLLFEQTALGAGQTIASQGILHRGVKYALSAQAVKAAQALTLAQGEWEDALAGKRGPDLRGVETYTTHMHFWTKPGLVAGLTGAAASLAMKSGVRKLLPDQLPAAFAGAPRGTPVWEVQERCIHTHSLLRALRDSARGRIFIGDVAAPADYSRGIEVLAAGIGNEALLSEHGYDAAALCQRRPLHMVMARGAPFDFFGHCLQELSDKPRLTITTSNDCGNRIWYIGGNIAESGLTRGEGEQIDAALEELRVCMPWVDLNPMQWATIRVDRAEGKTADGRRPDGPVMHAFPNTVAIWPTKLALAPAAAAMVVEHISRIAPPLRKASGTNISMSDALRIPIAPAPWQLPATNWHSAKGSP